MLDFYEVSSLSDYERIIPRTLNLDDPDPHHQWLWHNQVRESQTSNGNDDYFAAISGRNTDVSSLLPNVEFGSYGNPNIAPTLGDAQAKVDGRNADAQNAMNLQRRTSQLLTDIWNKRDGALYANPYERAKLERQLKTTLEIASAQGVFIEMRPATDPINT